MGSADRRALLKWPRLPSSPNFQVCSTLEPDLAGKLEPANRGLDFHRSNRELWSSMIRLLSSPASSGGNVVNICRTWLPHHEQEGRRGFLDVDLALQQLYTAGWLAASSPGSIAESWFGSAVPLPGAIC